jgi:hypothetical protein
MITVTASELRGDSAVHNAIRIPASPPITGCHHPCPRRDAAGSGKEG